MDKNDVIEVARIICSKSGCVHPCPSVGCRDGCSATPDELMNEYGEAATAIVSRPSPSTPSEGVIDEEGAAKRVYEAMLWAVRQYGHGSPPPWVERGNSHAQTEARCAARDIAALARLSPLPLVEEGAP
jgi:hypothetical protein